MNVSPNIHAILALQQDPDPFQLVQDVLQSPLLDAALLACLGLVVCLWLALVARAYTDATRRDTTPTFWALLCFVLPFLGYLIYAVVRPLEYADERKERELRLAALRREARGEDHPAGPQEEAAEEDCYPCPSCGGAVAEDFLACPSCGEHLKDACAACSRPLEPEWILCPYCPGVHPSGRGTGTDRQEVPRRPVPAPSAGPGTHDGGGGGGGRGRQEAGLGEIHAVRSNRSPDGPSSNGSPNGRTRLRDVRTT